MTRRLPFALGGALLATAVTSVLPDAALAHGLVGKQDIPIPRWLFAWAAAVVLVASFVGLGILWTKPRLEAAQERLVLRVPAALEVLLGALGTAAFAVVVYAGYAGTQTAADNLTPTVIYVLFGVGVPFATVLLGTFFPALSPWRAVARATGWVLARAGVRRPAPRPYPAWLGRWPAAIGVLAFAWVELVYVNRDDPSKLATMALVYAALQLAGSAFYGTETWRRNGDAFSVYFGLFAMLSPLHWRGRGLHLRPPLGGAPRLVAVPGTVALLCVMIGTTSFDGFSQGDLWNSSGGLGPVLQQRFINLGLNADLALEVAATLGLLFLVGFVAGLYRLGVVGMRSIGGRHDPSVLGRTFVHSLIPIALAYVVAHYFSLFAYQTQAMAFLVSDPLGHGSNLFGTASASIDYNVIGATGVWYVQVAALLCGHVAGLCLAHDRALVRYERLRDATRSQYWMLAVMVGFTSLGLFILSTAA
ncbi:MAG: hypothetical protein QOG35_1057 [Solirubrobacteraceae bacterium]|nr:hypothetical protein [Solirubrobacteraceae bacterium]